MWHYEYRLEDRELRFEAETFEDCLVEVLSARNLSPHLTAVRVFEGGSMDFGSGIKRYDALEPAVSLN